ncbi:hypothetical protein [Streptomyces sp. NBC_01187]|uniref:hypothetical protein n=1 Tax=Streptomyces sp. NBC_01187 TaxID=2903766 RepID=UPI003866A5BF|nr:hypothetical protein OG220_16340 [Streptomyces sp. NBC_01187]
MNLAIVTRHGYWCECWTQSPATGADPALLGSFDASSARQAIRWVRTSLLAIASALDEEPYRQARYWVTDGQTYSAQALHQGRSFSLTLSQRSTHITWTARPVTFLPFVHRHGKQLPPCAYEFSPKDRTKDQTAHA